MTICSRFAAGLLAGICMAADAPRRHVEAIGSGPHTFTIRLGGTVDGFNSRDPIVYNAWKQSFEPMRSVRIENTGAADIRNPSLVVNGRRNWRTVRDIARQALEAYGGPAGMSDGEKARAIFEFQRTNRFHATTGDLEVRDPVLMYNAYGYSLCGDNAAVLADLWRAAGLETRRGFPIGHCVAEVWYDGGWHMLDADESVLFLERDNRTVAAEQRVAHDHDLARRAYDNEMLGSLYTWDAAHSGDFPSHTGRTMDFTLRPGESLEWRWDHSGKHHHAPLPSVYTLESTQLSRWGDEAWNKLANGRWLYAPDSRTPSGRRTVDSANVRWAARPSDPAVSAAAGPEPARLAWKIETPYPLVGGRLRASVRGNGTVVFSVSLDGERWTEAVRAAGGSREFIRSLDAYFPNEGPALHRYFLRAELRDASLDAIAFENDLQMAPLSLPALQLGENRIAYSAESGASGPARVTFDWVERDSARPPQPPAPRFPAEAAAVEGTRFTIEWEAVPGAAAYHFQLADHPSFRWALSPAFDVMSSNPSFAPRSAGLLNPGQRCYWRVRAKSAEGVWGAWSAARSFTPQGPGTPLNLRLVESGPNRFTLAWDRNPSGRMPSTWKVYGSNERGFMASDEPYRAPVGNQVKRGLFPGERTREFPPNRIAIVKEPRLDVTPRFAFYRVVAVDDRGVPSGSSEMLAAPRPFIYSEPVLRATAGQPYRYEVKTVSSIGDLTHRDFGPGQSYQAAYWDVDRPAYSLEVELPRCGTFDPKWLKVDPASGVLSGTPGTADSGEYQVNVKVEIPGAGAFVQSYGLRVESGRRH